MSQENPIIASPTVIIVDDDEAVTKSLRFLMDSKSIRCQVFNSGVEFLEAVKKRPPWLQSTGCIFLDVRMPNLSGVEVFGQLRKLQPNLALPVLFMTAHGDVPVVTKVLKDGAYDFLEKPVSSERLLARLDDCFEHSRQRLQVALSRKDFAERLRTLTEREMAVMARLYDGLSNKEIAELLGNSVRTIELRRATIYSKMGVKSSIELARLLQSSDWQPPPYTGKDMKDTPDDAPAGASAAPKGKPGRPPKASSAAGNASAAAEAD